MTLSPRVLIPLLVLGTGCATTLSTHQTAVPIAPGHVEATLATGFYVPVGATASAIAQGHEQVTEILVAAATGQEYQVSPDQQQRLLTAGIALAVMPPSPSQELNVRTGILSNWDAGLRYSINAVRLDTKYRLYHWDEGEQMAEPYRRNFDVAVGLAASKYLFSNPVLDVLQFVELGDFNRWDLEVPVYVSYDWGYIWKVYGAAKYVLSRTEFDSTLVNTAAQAGNVTGLDLTLPNSVTTQFFGVTAGVMVGYRWAHLALELTGGYTHCRPYVLGQRRDLGGLTLYPSVGVVVRI